MKMLLSLFAIFLLTFSSSSVRAEANVGYFGFEPDITTNYIRQSSKKLGYIRVTVDLMLNDMKKGYFTKIVCYDLSRISRNMGELVKTLSLLDDYKISLFCWKQNLDTDDGGLGKMFFYFVGIFNEIESTLRKERQLTSINRLRTVEGFKYGGNDLISNETKDKVRQLREEGLSYRKIHKEVPHISLSSIGNIVKEVRI